MPKSMKQQQLILMKVEELMLQGKLRLFEIRNAVEGINDTKTARIYRDAVKTRWSEETGDREGVRSQLIKETEAQKRRLEERLRNTKNEAIQQSVEKIILKAREQQADLAGLKEQKLVLAKEKTPFDELSDKDFQQELLKSLPDDMIKLEAKKRFQEIRELLLAQEKLTPQIEEGKIRVLPLSNPRPKNQNPNLRSKNEVSKKTIKKEKC